MTTGVLQRRPDRRAVWIALGTTVMMNGALYALLALLHRAPPEPAAELPVVRRVERVVPPPPPPLALTQPAVATPAAAAPQVAVAAPPLPALPDFTPQLALPAAAMPQITPTTVVRLPAVTAAGAGGQSGNGGGAAAQVGTAGGPDQAPFLINGFEMERFYPRAARLRGTEGTSQLLITIDAAGRVTACKLLASDPPGVFDKAAEDLGFAMKFLPARSNGSAASTTVPQQIIWKLPR